jgi:hypothetical protein
MRVFQVTHPDLWREFPPLQSLDAFPGNLPVQLTSFVGREKELAGIAKGLDEWRMVTLTGTGGVGKTRLAIQVVRGGVADVATLRDVVGGERQRLPATHGAVGLDNCEHHRLGVISPSRSAECPGYGS